MPRMEDHEVHKDMWWQRKKKTLLKNMRITHSTYDNETELKKDNIFRPVGRHFKPQ